MFLRLATCFLSLPVFIRLKWLLCSLCCVGGKRKLLPMAESSLNSMPPAPATLPTESQFLFWLKSRPGEILQKDRARDSTVRVPSERRVVQARHSTLKRLLFRENWLKVTQEVTGSYSLLTRAVWSFQVRAPRRPEGSSWFTKSVEPWGRSWSERYFMFSGSLQAVFELRVP